MGYDAKMEFKKVSVLVVEDNVGTLKLMQAILEPAGYLVFKASDGPTAIQVFMDEEPDLVLLDIMLPSIDGYAVCQHIREFSRVPIIMVSAKNDVKERIYGLNAGADDYLGKPFNSEELLARIRVVMRRSEDLDNSRKAIFSSHDLVVDFAQCKVTLGGQELNLTPVEYRILLFMAHNANMILTPEQILRSVWGEEYEGGKHALQTSIYRLRRKLEDNFRNPSYIITRCGIGYEIRS